MSVNLFLTDKYNVSKEIHGRHLRRLSFRWTTFFDKQIVFSDREYEHAAYDMNPRVGMAQKHGAKRKNGVR